MLKYTRKRGRKMENKLLEKIKKMPKVELHMHLDGSIPISYVINKYNLKKEEIEKYMIADDKCKNLIIQYQ